MEKIALYRKYRPRDFDNVIGQVAIVKSLINHVVSAKINHAYIFAGTKGSGKTSLAKIYAKAINCTNHINGNPCNQCANCLAINSNSCSDILELDAASNNGVNEIRAIIDAINYVPSQLNYKVYIIDEAHMLTSNSWNALLKTLEEPPSHVILIFATTEFHKIPATIISRCQRFDFTKIEKLLLNNLLNKIAKSENIIIDEESLNSIVTLANGSARDALSVLDQLANYTNKNIKIDAINELFGLVSIHEKIKFLNALINKELDLCLSMIKQFNQAGINFLLLAHDLLEIIMEKIIYSDTKNLGLLNLLDEESLSLIATVADAELIAVMKLINEALSQIKNSGQPEVIFEYYSLLICKGLNTQDTKPEIKIKTNKVEPIKKPETILTTPKSDELFKTSELVIKSLKPEVITPNQTPEHVEQLSLNIEIEEQPQQSGPSVAEMYNEEFQNNFFSIASNYAKEQTVESNATLQQLKSEIGLNQPEINLLLGADKILISSQNGCVLLFNNISQVKHFNKIKDSEVLNKFYKEHFKHQQFLIAIDINKARQLKTAYQNLTQKNLPDVKIKQTVSDDKKTKLLDILNDDTNI